LVASRVRQESAYSKKFHHQNRKAGQNHDKHYNAAYD